MKITKIEPETVDLWHDDEGFIGSVNEYEFNDCRIQIMEEKAEGYYVLKDNNKYYIDSDGRLPKWNFFNLINDQLCLFLYKDPL